MTMTKVPFAARCVRPLRALRNSVFEVAVDAYPAHKGKGRWMNLLSHVLRIEPYGNYKPRSCARFHLCLDPGDPSDQLYFFGLCGDEHLPMLSSLLRSEDCVIDVGANVGSFAAMAGEIVGPSGSVYAIEANPRLVDKLSRSFANAPNVKIVHAAACATSGTVAFSVATFSGWSSLRPNCTFDVAEQLSVPAITLDDLARREALSRVRLLKLDIEGGEFGALQGARETLRAGIVEFILTEVEPLRMRAFEWSGKDLSCLLGEAGYVPVGFKTIAEKALRPTTPETYAPGAFAADYLYVREPLRDEAVHQLFYPIC